MAISDLPTSQSDESKARALLSWKHAQEAQLPPEQDAFRAVPQITADQPGFEHVLGLLNRNVSFAFCKLNHGFWERLVKLEEQGIHRDALFETPGAQIDDLLGVAGSFFAQGGLLSELLGRLQALPAPQDGPIFVPSLAPWPLAARIEGTPLQSRARCEDLIGHFVPASQLFYAGAHGFTGHEFKVAAITGGMARFLAALQGRQVLLIANPANRALMDAAGLEHLDVIEVDARNARHARVVLRDQLFSYLDQSRAAARPPVVIAAAGGALTTWLGLQAIEAFETLHFVDLGGALTAYEAQSAPGLNWTRAYRRQLAETVQVVPGLPQTLRAAYMGPYGLRDTAMVELAKTAGVPAPGTGSTGEQVAPQPLSPVPFIENKIYDYARMADFLSLSVAANHHANGGPVAALLEQAVAQAARLRGTRKVVAVSSGTAALHLACGYHAYQQGQARLRWVTSAFNFFSSQVGVLADGLVIDSTATGGFDLEALKALPLEAYDGVIYTNVFAQHSDWDDLAAYCQTHDKALVIDNATGLCDRSLGARSADAPIEIVSGHHTKPWGVGEGGFVICSPTQEPVLRQLANFGARLPAEANPMAANFKISDLAAAAILDRLERMPYWAFYYHRQERRNLSMMVDAGLGITPLPASTKILSPRAHTPFLSPHPVEMDAVSGPVTLRKYYRPLTPQPGARASFSNAASLYARTFSLSNAPEMRLVANEAIIAQVTAMIGAANDSGPEAR